MSRESFILALDQGTTSSRAILFDRAGRIRCQQQKEFTQYFPRPGLVEHNPEEIWLSQLQVLQGVLDQAGIRSEQVAAVGIANQRETVVVWDRSTGKPVCPAIVWQDRRTADLCARLIQEGHQASVHQRTGLRLDPYFSATKLSWILDNIPSVRKRARNGDIFFGTIDSWLLWNLTAGQVHATDVSNASRTLLLDLKTGEWAEDMLELFRIPREMLPEVRPSSEVYGTVDSGLLDGKIPISGMAGDQQAALFGQACTRPGMCKNTYGTGCFLLMNTGDKPYYSTNELLSTIAWKLDGSLTYALEGSVFVAGAAVQWLRDGLGIINSAPECDTLAASIPDSGGVYLVPAFTGLGAPHWDPDARGILVGLTRGTGKAQICRAVLEAIAFQSVELIECMQRDYGGKLDELRVDGGAARSDCLMQIQADFLNAPVCRPGCTETTALGAAFLAGLAVGFWDGLESIGESWKAGTVFHPAADEATRLFVRRNWNRAVDRSRNWSVTE